MIVDVGTLFALIGFAFVGSITPGPDGRKCHFRSVWRMKHGPQFNSFVRVKL